MNSSVLVKRFGINALAYGYGQIVTILVQFVQVPLFLHFWGVQKYAEWLVLTGFPILLGIIDLGVAQASASKCSLESGRGNYTESRNTLKTAQVYTLSVSFLLVFLVSSLCFFVDFSKFLSLRLVGGKTANIVILFFTLSLCINLQGGVLDAWMRSFNKPAQSGFINANARVFETFFATLALLFGGDFVAVSAAFLLASITIRYCHLIAALRAAPKELSCFGSFSFRGLQEIIKPSIGFISFSLSQALSIQGGIQLVNRFGSPSDVVSLNLSRTLVRTIFQIGVVINNALRAEFSRMIGSGLHLQADLFMTKIWIRSLFVAALVYFAIIFFGPEFILFWSHKSIEVSGSFLFFIGLHSVLGVFWYVPASVRMAENTHCNLALYYAGIVLATLCTWIIFHPIVHPLVGACLLLIIPELFMSFFTAKDLILKKGGKFFYSFL